MIGRVRRAARRTVSHVVWPAARRHRTSSSVLLHEWFTAVGGSDKVASRLTTLAQADVVYTFALDRSLPARLGVDAPVVTWRFGEWAARSRRFHLLLPLMPLVWWSLDLEAARRVVTSSHSCVNAARAPGAERLSYVHTPMRYAWAIDLERERIDPPLAWLLPVVGAVFRRLDCGWSRRVDVMLANSEFIAGRIRRAYGRAADVVPPPIDTRFWTPATRDGERRHFLVAGRLIAYKRPDLAVRAANRAAVPLIVAGGGAMLTELEQIAGPTVSIRVHPDDDELRDLMRSATALVFPGVEDFGMLPVEAQACGTPVIALGEGGATTSVVDGVTGVLVADDRDVTWASALSTFDGAAFDPVAIRENAERFSEDRFDAAIMAAFDRMGWAAPEVSR